MGVQRAEQEQLRPSRYELFIQDIQEHNVIHIVGTIQYDTIGKKGIMQYGRYREFYAGFAPGNDESVCDYRPKIERLRPIAYGAKRVNHPDHRATLTELYRDEIQQLQNMRNRTEVFVTLRDVNDRLFPLNEPKQVIEAQRSLNLIPRD